MSIRIKLEGFDELLSRIEKAGGSIDKAAEACINKSADIMNEELRTQMQNSKVSQRLINEMPPPNIEKEGNRYSAEVGYKKGAYDPNNISDAYKVVFLNYGTPKRAKHGKVKARGFIGKAKRNATKKIKKQQEDMLNEILRKLEQ